MDTTRRELLATIGVTATVGTSGCGSPVSPEATQTPTETPTSSPGRDPFEPPEDVEFPDDTDEVCQRARDEVGLSAENLSGYSVDYTLPTGLDSTYRVRYDINYPGNWTIVEEDTPDPDVRGRTYITSYQPPANQMGWQHAGHTLSNQGWGIQDEIDHMMGMSWPSSYEFETIEVNPPLLVYEMTPHHRRERGWIYYQQGPEVTFQTNQGPQAYQVFYENWITLDKTCMVTTAHERVAESIARSLRI